MPLFPTPFSFLPPKTFFCVSLGVRAVLICRCPVRQSRKILLPRLLKQEILLTFSQGYFFEEDSRIYRAAEAA